MPDTSLSIPAPPVAVGIATKLGVVVGALAALLGPLSTVLAGDQTPEALGALAVAGLAFASVVLGRSHQAAANTTATATLLAADRHAETQAQAQMWQPSPPTIELRSEPVDESGEGIAESEGVHEFELHDPLALPPDTGDAQAVAAHGSIADGPVIGK